MTKLIACCCLCILFASQIAASGVTYLVLWFDTEDYIDPKADDAALRIATDLSHLGVHATFKVVGEKARVLQQRSRQDVIQALKLHCLGYHSDWHSIQPVPAVSAEHLGLLEGADDFESRQSAGLHDLEHIFGVKPACYGQPGSSWTPQSNIALRRMGIHVYLDDGSQVGYNNQPFWYGGLLYVFNLGPYQLRAALDPPGKEHDVFQQFDAAVQHFSQTGGGLISTYYHPTEMVHTEFWDAVNFSKGLTKPREQWILPARRTEAESQRCYRALEDYVKHAKSMGVQFVTASDLLRIYAEPRAPQIDKMILARHFTQNIDLLSLPEGDLSAADILLELLSLPLTYVDGPARHGITTYTDETIPGYLFENALKETRAFIQQTHRLPDAVFIGAKSLSLEDFAATLAAHIMSPGTLHVTKGKVGFDRYFATNAKAAFNWPIHPEGFAPEELLQLGRLQGWTLKPARLSSVPNQR